MTETPRKRNNSLIPIEFRNDTSDGGMERAALATVFGVKEYTESKIFWSHDEPARKSYITGDTESAKNNNLPLIPVVSAFDDFWAETSFTPSTPTPPPPSFNLSPPADLSDLPLTLFDLLISDDNPNIILWSVHQSVVAADQGENKKKSRWSATLRKKLSTPNLQQQQPQQQIQEHCIIEAATIEKLIEKLTITLDYTFMTDFFLIFRVFMTPLQLCKFLILRFKWSLERNEENRCIVRIRTFVVMRHWLLNYFLHDFVPNKELRVTFTQFLNEMPSHPVIKHSVRDQRIIKGLKRVVRRLKKLYYASSSSSRVKVIGPPPPTEHQQQVKALVQEKLLQNSSIRHRTLNIVNGIHVDTRHSNNTAVRDQQTAPVVVIGTYKNSLPENRRGSTTSSKRNKANSVHQQQQNEDFYLSNLSDSSLESVVSPGTSDIEDDEEEAFIESPSEHSLHSNFMFESNVPLNTASHISHVSGDQLTQKLEQLQLQQELDTRPRSFYSAQLAIPSDIPTPDIIYPIPNNLLNSTSYNSMAYPSVTESEAVTPSNAMGSSKRTSSSTFMDPKVKPLPALDKRKSMASSISSYAKVKPLPSNNESWKLSVRKKEANVPKSRIMEIDINPTQFQVYSPAILNYPTSLVAQQLCLIEKAILLDINWEELVDCRWTRMSASSYYQPNVAIDDVVPDLQGMYSRTKRMKQQHDKDNPERGIEKAINRFNAVCQWVSSEIVQTKQMHQRVKVIEKFIRLAKKCKLYCNFSTLIQILLGLQSSSVSRLEKTWSKVDKRVLKTLQELSSFTSPTKNWKQIRDSMTQVAEEYGESPTEIQVQVDKKLKNSVTIKLPFGGCIPFLGIYLSDLVFNAELSSYLPSTNNNIEMKHRGMIDTVLTQPLVHFRKHRVTATVIKRVLLFQNLAKRYSFEETQDSALYSMCFNVASLDSDAIQKLSYEVEPPQH